MGFIERVDLILTGHDFNRAYIHFAPGRWNMRCASARNALTILQKGEEALEIEYKEPYFWKAYISSSKRPTNEEIKDKLRIRASPPVRRENPARRKKVIDLEPANFASAMITLEKNGTISSAERQSFVKLQYGEHKLTAEAAYELFKDDGNEEKMLETLRIICNYNKKLMQTSVTQLDANDPIGARVLSNTPSPKWGDEQC